MIRCVGCGEQFESSTAFELHAKGFGRIAKRCRSSVELLQLGMKRSAGSHAWYVPTKAKVHR